MRANRTGRGPRDPRPPTGGAPTWSERAMAATSAEAVADAGLVESAARRPADLAARDVREWVRREQTEAEEDEEETETYILLRCDIYY